MSYTRKIIFRLALRLGYANPDAMLAEMPFTVFREWLEYMRLEPFSEYRDDVRIALPISQLANILGRAKGRPAFKVDAFLPKWKSQEPPKPQTYESMLAKMIQMNKALGGEFTDNRKPKDA